MWPRLKLFAHFRLLSAFLLVLLTAWVPGSAQGRLFDNSDGYSWSVSDPVGGWVQRLRQGTIAPSFIKAGLSADGGTEQPFVCFNFKIGAGAQNPIFDIILINYQGSPILNLQVLDAGFGNRFNLNGTISSVSGNSEWEDNRWYRLTIYLDYTNRMVHLLLNNGTITSVPFNNMPNPSSPLERLHLVNQSGNSDVFVDNIYVGTSVPLMVTTVSGVPGGSMVETRDMLSNTITGLHTLADDGGTGGWFTSDYWPGITRVMPVTPGYNYSPTSITREIDGFSPYENFDFISTPAQYSINITSPNGSVSKSPNQSTYNHGTSVSLTVTPNAGYNFAGWSGDASGTANPLWLWMDGNKSVTANYEIRNYSLTTNASNGSISRSPNASSYNHGTVVTLTATPAANYSFTGWSGDVSGASNPITVTMNGPRTVTANFVIQQRTLTTSATNGTISRSPNATSYNHGAVVALTATPNAGYTFTGWSGAITGTTNPVNVTMDANKTVTANFALATRILTTTANNGTITRSPNASSYANGTVVTLTAIPNAGYTFTGWSGAVTGATNPVNVTMDADKSVTANFVINTYPLTTNATNGTITRSPNAAAYNHGTVVTLTATPAANYVFTGWSGDVTGSTNPITVTMNGARSVTANFAINQRTLTTNAANGTITRSPNAAAYNHGTVVSLTATPAANYVFTGWSGAVTGSTNPISVTMDADKSVTATFALVNRTLTTTATNGTVSRSPNAASYPHGTVVALTATPNAGYTFTGWSGAVTGAANPVNVIMDADKSVTANFVINTYPLTTNATNGTITRSPNAAAYNHGTVVTLTATAAANYVFTGWSGDVAGTTNPATVTMSAARSVTANFILINRTLTTSATNGTISRSPNAATYPNGTVVTLTPAPSAGYYFAGWSGDATGAANPLNVAMDADKSITATFLVLPNYTLSVSYLNGTVTKSPNQASYVSGSSVLLDPVANPNYAFTGWSGDATGSADPLTVVMNGSKSITANFALVNRTLVTTPGTGGTITRDLPGPAYPHGSTVYLTAVPNAGYVFVRWGTDGAGTYSPLKVVMNGNKTITAVFAVSDVRLTISPTPAGGTIRTQPNPNASGFYKYGQKVLLTPAPAAGNKFLGWAGAATGAANPHALIMDGDKTVSATFGPIPFFTLTLTQAANGALTASPLPGPNGYLEGSKVVLAAKPNPNYAFGGWTGAAQGTKPVTLLMNGNKTVSGSFVTAPPISLTVINNSGTTTESVLQHALTPITTTIPLDKGFSHWEIVTKQTPKVAVNFTNKSSPTSATVRVSGGNATVRAVFLDPRLEVAVKDDAAGAVNKARSKPVISLKTLDAGLLNGFMLRYYFKMECAFHPILTTSPPAGWTITLNDADGNGDNGGNWFLEYIHTGTLAGRSQILTPTVDLSFTCPEACNPKQVWIRSNDHSSSKSVGKWAKNGYIPVYKNPGDADPFTGAVPFLIVDPIPETAPPGENTTYPIPPPQPTAPPQPNLIFSQAFSEGDFLANGSFEHDSLGWEKWGGSGAAYSIVLHNPGEGAFDGGKFMAVDPTGSSVEGIYYEIPETHPAYGFLNGKTVTLAAWLRKPAAVTGTVGVKLVQLDNGTNGSGNTAIPLDGTWQFATQTLANLTGATFGGAKSFRFAVVEAASGQNLGFHVDAVSLTVGEKAVPPVITTKLTSTRHVPLQTRTFLAEDLFGYDALGLRLSIGNTEYDALGREKKTYLAYPTDCGGDDCNPFFDSAQFSAQIARANQLFQAGNTEGLPNAGNYAFKESEYEHDQKVTILRTGRPGTNFSLASGNTRETFYSGVNSLGVSELGADLTNPTNKSLPRYAFKYTEDENGHGSMEWKDGFGLVVRTAGLVTENSVERATVSDNFYDARGNLVKSHSPMSCQDRTGLPSGGAACVAATLFEYDDEDRLVQEIHPDAGTTRYFHDFYGRARITQMAHQAAGRKFTVSRYDAKARLIETGEFTDRNNQLSTAALLRERAQDLSWPSMTDPDYRIHSVYYYDKMPAPVPTEFAGLDPDFRLYPEELINTFEFTKGKLCAVVTLQPPVDALSEADAETIEEISAKANRFDKFGRITETFTYNGFITNPAYKLQKVAAAFDHAGRTIETRNFSKADDYQASRVSRYSYDVMGRVKEIVDVAGNSIARYTYFDHDGKLKTITLDGSDPDSVHMQYSYHISGGLSSIRVQRPSLGAQRTLYRQALYYDQPPAVGSIPQYNGNISQNSYSLSQLTIPADGERQAVYGYDELNRLRKVAYEVVDATTNTKDNQFDGEFGYDLNGRITYQRTGSRAASTVTSGGEYAYGLNTHRLAYVNNGMGDGSLPDRSGTLSNPNFRYDSAGNMVQDRSKDMIVEYDYRGLPLSYSYKDGTQALHQMVVRYDHEGSRISKIQFDQGGAATIEFLVDADSDRERDYANLTAAYDDLKAKAAAINSEVDKMFIYMVYETGPFRVPVTAARQLRSLFLQDGRHTVSVAIRGLQFNTEEYWALVGGRKGMTYASATHYTGIGNELRQSGSGTAAIPKIMTSLPQGLGRYENGSSEKVFNVKDHLGNTRLGIHSSPAAGYDVYDYSAYGKQEKVSVVHAGDEKITEGFTGKELDEQVDLMYFGARYFDPGLGMWISPDAARQYHSPYTYCGNNPTGCVDKDGNFGAAAYLSNGQVHSSVDIANMGRIEVIGGQVAAGVMMGALTAGFGAGAAAGSPAFYGVAHEISLFAAGRSAVFRWIFANPAKSIGLLMAGGMAAEELAGASRSKAAISGLTGNGAPAPWKFVGNALRSGVEMASGSGATGGGVDNLRLQTPDLNFSPAAQDATSVDL